MKIVLVGVNAKYTHTNLAIRHLKNYGADERIEIAEYTINMPLKQIEEDLKNKNADVYGFSVYIWNVGIVYALADRLSGAVILFGGPEATYAPEEALRHGDYVIRGEGEKAFARFAGDFFAGKSVEETPSLCFMKGNTLCLNPPSEKAPLDMLRQPYFDLPLIKRRIIYYESSRGCPFSCAYCLSSAEKGVRFASVEKVKADMDIYAAAGVMKVKFVDRTFNADRGRAAEIVRHVVACGKGTEFHFEIEADLVDNALVEALSKAEKGKVQLEIGVQSTHIPTLEAIGRVQDFAYTSKMVQAIVKNKNVAVHLDLIAGLPLEGGKAFQKSFDDVMGLGADAVQLGFLKMLKGSRMDQLAENYGILASKTAPYEVMQTKDISYEELLLLKRIAYLLERFYNSGLFKISVKVMSSLVGGYYAFFQELSHYVESREINLRQLGESGLARLLWDYSQAKEERLLMEDAVRADCLRKPRRPVLDACLERKEEWQRTFYKNMPPEYAKAMPVGKRPWHYSRVESFAFDLPLYLEQGILANRDIKLFFNYVDGSIKEIFPG